MESLNVNVNLHFEAGYDLVLRMYDSVCTLEIGDDVYIIIDSKKDLHTFRSKMGRALKNPIEMK